jgi:PAS domain S-box-containing protein
VRFFRSLQGKILLFFFLIDVATVWVLVATVSGTARETLEKTLEQQLDLTARTVSNGIGDQLTLKWDFMKSLASNTFMVNSVIDPVGRRDYLVPFMQRLELPGLGGDETDVWLVDFAGRAIARNKVSPAGPEHAVHFAAEPWWPRVREGTPVVTVTQREGHAHLLVAFPVLYQQHAEGAVVSEFDLSHLREIALRNGLEAALLSSEGTLFGFIPSEALSRIRSLGPTPTHDTFLQEDTLYLVEPMEGFSRQHALGWSLVLTAPAEKLTQPLQELRQRMIGAGALLGVLFAVVVVWGTRGLLHPLERIEDTMRRIVDGGDLSQRIRLQSRDELGSIARTFDEMLERLQQRTAELERSRDKAALLAHITSVAPSAIALLDLQGKARVWNQSAESLFGWSLEQLADSSFLAPVVPADAGEAVSELITRARATGQPAEAEVSLMSRGAGPVLVHLLVTRMADAAGQPMGYLFIMRDQREVKRLRESLVQSEKMAAMGTLVAGLSHELNNPLGIIIGYAQGLARRSGLDEGVRGAVASIERQAQRCAQLVRALLDFSRKKVPVRERVAVSALFGRVSELVRGQAHRAGVSFEVLPPSQALPELEVSVQEIESALLNLITNALDATPGGGSVQVSAQPVAQGGGVELVVTDTGSGMSEEVLQRAFDPFFTTKPVGQGTGLGLSITRNIVEAHGGAIDVKTSPGAGTTVRLWLPAAGAPPQAHRMEATAWK